VVTAFELGERPEKMPTVPADFQKRAALARNNVLGGAPRQLFLMLPAILILLALSIAPLVTALVWSFWRWDPAIYWIVPDFSLNAYAALFTTGRVNVLMRTATLAFVAASLSVLIGFPIAYYLYRIAGRRARMLLLLLFVIPFLTSFIIRTFSWRFVLGRHGLINELLLSLGLINEPIEWLLFSDFAVEIGLLSSYFPFVIFPILLALNRVEPNLLNASRDLGADFWTTLRLIVLPLAFPGIFAGFLFVFVLALGSSVEVQLLGGAGASMIAIMIDDVMRVLNFPLAFAITSTVVAILVSLLYVGNRFLGVSRLFQHFTW
jgi:putative spermidine/putrescine transport system permease protein